jgi:glycosyltransferase involved in cell wall biosynthesis
MHAEPEPTPSLSVPPDISVALCTFNGATYLQEQIASLRSQRDVSIEFVVVDDGSSDATLGLLQTWQQQDPRVQLHCNGARLGFSDNFRKAMSLCRGRWIAPCDQDDIWEPDKLARLQQEIKEHSLAYADSDLIDEAGHTLHLRMSDRCRMLSGHPVLALALWNCVSGHALLVRRDLLELAPMPPEARYHDWWIAFSAARLAGIVFVDEVLVHYRQHANSQTDVAQRKKIRRGTWRRYNERVRWLGVISACPGPQQAALQTLHRLWKARETQWFCPELAAWVWRRRVELFAVNRRERPWRFALKCLFGMKFRFRPEVL